MCKQREAGRTAPTDLLLSVESTGSHQVGRRRKMTVNQGKRNYIASCAKAGCLCVKSRSVMRLDTAPLARYPSLPGLPTHFLLGLLASVDAVHYVYPFP